MMADAFVNLHKKIENLIILIPGEDKNADIKSICSLAQIYLFNNNNITHLPVAWVIIMLKYHFYNLSL